MGSGSVVLTGSDAGAVRVGVNETDAVGVGLDVADAEGDTDAVGAASEVQPLNTINNDNPSSNTPCLKRATSLPEFYNLF
jgi:hypothetical protein